MDDTTHRLPGLFLFVWSYRVLQIEYDRIRSRRDGLSQLVLVRAGSEEIAPEKTTLRQ
jgi:hypothetical protein